MAAGVFPKREHSGPVRPVFSMGMRKIFCKTPAHTGAESMKKTEKTTFFQKKS
jgi:hypothetical protein